MIANFLFDLAITALTPKPDLGISDWARDYRKLSKKQSEIAGDYDVSLYPWCKEIMDVMSPQHPAQEIVEQKPVQSGGTEAVFNGIGYHMHWDPCPIAYYLPTEKGNSRIVSQKLQPLFDTPEIAERIIGDPSKQPKRVLKDSQTREQINFAGGILALGSMNSKSDLRSISARIVVLDDLDAAPLDVEGEGCPVKLAYGRLTTFNKRKLVLISTPSDEDHSRIGPLYEESSKGLFNIQCPHCNEWQPLWFDHLKYEGKGQGLKKSDWSNPVYVCQKHGCIIHEHEKHGPIKNGKWVHERPKFFRMGYHWNSLYALTGYTWVDMAKEYESATNDEQAMKTFVNLRLAQVAKSTQKMPEAEELMKKAQPFRAGQVPEWARVLVGSVDVQGNRLEVLVRAVGARRQVAIVDHFVLMGKTSDPEDGAWTALEALYDRTWVHPLGGIMKLTRIGVDSGFQTQAVYRWVQRNSDWAIALKGYSNRGANKRPIISFPSGGYMRTAGGEKIAICELWPVGVDTVKDDLKGILSQLIDWEPGEPFFGGFLHFNADMTLDNFNQIVAEQKVKKISQTGVVSFAWQPVRPGVRNEMLDLLVYGEAVDHTLNLPYYPPDHPFWDQELAKIVGE